MATNRRMTAGTIGSTDPGVKGVAITGAAQAVSGRAILVETAGSITGQLLEDTADVTYALPVGLWPLAFKSITSVATLAGKIIE